MVTSYPANGKLLSKSGDPGIPTISCSIGKTDIHNALCDLGAGVSVMPYSLYKRLGLGGYSPLLSLYRWLTNPLNNLLV